MDGDEMRFARIILSALTRLIEAPVAFLLERFLRLKSLLNPSAWPNAKRIDAVHEGNLCHASGEVAVFAASYTETYPLFFMNLFEALKAARIDVVIVSNRALSAQNISFLQSHCRWLLIRKNIGRDFGAYADALRFLGERNVVTDRLFFFNDSLYYRDVDHLIPLLHDLRSGDFTCATASLSPIPHAQSFCMSFSRKTCSHPLFRKYWATYFPIDSRRWAISRGELGLSIILRKANFVPQPVFSSLDVGRALLSAQKSGDRELVAALPQFSAIRSILSDYAVRPSSASKGAGLSNLYASLDYLSSQISAFIEKLSLDAARPSPGETSSVGHVSGSESLRGVSDFFLTEDLLRELAAHSPIHSCGLLWWRHTNFPLMKRDILFRGVFSALQLELFFGQDPSHLSNLMKHDLSRRQEGRFLVGWEGFLFRKGFL
jgi:hypothetical protein